MENIFKPIEKKENIIDDFEGVFTATAWLNDTHKKDTSKDCQGNEIMMLPVSFLNDDKGNWKQADKLLKSFIGKLKNPVMIVKEFNNEFIDAVTPDVVMKFATSFKKKPSLRLGASIDGSKVLKGISSDNYYFYHSDTIRFMIFEDSVENEKKMREIL